MNSFPSDWVKPSVTPVSNSDEPPTACAVGSKCCTVIGTVACVVSGSILCEASEVTRERLHVS